MDGELGEMAVASKTKAEDKVAAPQKRLILITGDKGGTGKSTFGRGLLDTLQHRQIDCLAYDSDKRNSQLYRHYKDGGAGVKKIDITVKGGGDVLIDEMDQRQAAVMLVDLPAGAGEHLEKFEREMGFIAAAAEMGYGVTVVSVLSRVKDSINALRLMLEFTGDAVQHVAVKNLYFGEEARFVLFDESKVKQRLLESGGRVVKMDDLLDDTYGLVDQGNLMFRTAAGEGSPLARSHRARVYQWLKRFEAEVEPLGCILGMAS
jgi:hypothetical protein